MTLQFPTRQIHLDFHTPPDTRGVGDLFDGEQFAATLKAAGVESINIFAKDHHGYSFYPTKVGTMHPGLSRDLLGEQIAALHAAGIRAPVYVSIEWDDLAGQLHPEWVITTRDGRTFMRPPLSDETPLKDGQVGWTSMDVSSGYADYVNAQVAEICERYDVDGFWFDIVKTVPNFSPSGQVRMREHGVNLADPRAVRTYTEDRLKDFLARTSSTVRSYNPDASIFYNGTAGPNSPATLPSQTQLEVESLPTGAESQWGYLHYPINARFARSLDVPIVGMTGRFHLSWADFGGLKRTAQLDYECGTIIAAGGAVSIGDQLDPSGVLDAAVYRTIGSSFQHIANIEPWLTGSERVVEVGVLAGQQDEGILDVPAYLPGVDGAAQVLLELGIQFDIIDPRTFPVDRYEVIVVPDGYDPPDDVIQRIEAARAQGAKLVLGGLTTFDSQTGEFRLADVPVELLGEAPTIPSYIRGSVPEAVDPEFADDYDYAFYDQAYIVAPKDKAHALGELKRARYNRTWEHFYGHAQAPVGDSLDAPWGVLSEDVLYLAAPLFLAYLRHDYWVYRSLLEEAFNSLLPERRVRLKGPAWIETTLRTQPATEDRSARIVAHLTAFNPRRTTLPVARVDEGSFVQAGLQLTVFAPGEISRAYVAPDVDHDIDVTREGDFVTAVLPQLATHTVVVFE